MHYSYEVVEAVRSYLNVTLIGKNSTQCLISSYESVLVFHQMWKWKMCSAVSNDSIFLVLIVEGIRCRKEYSHLSALDLHAQTVEATI